VSRNDVQPENANRELVKGLLIAALVVGLPLAAVYWLAVRNEPGGPVEPGVVPEVVRSQVPAGERLSSGAPGSDPQSAYAGWAGTVADRTGIPARALQSYAVADLTVANTNPGCRLGWPTLAAIGAVESEHGRFDGRSLGGDGKPTSPVVGIPLDGSPGVQAIRDTDEGQLDGDRRWDRAVGPMQFLPATWDTWATDGDDDGIADPQDLDDAAVAAARYLCSSGRDLGTADGWVAAVLTYNRLDEYLNTVYDRATRYALDSRG
jgi:membrane-bound lytic murein transglycosylase B